MANFTFKGSNADDVILVGTNGQDILLTDEFGNVLTDLVGVDNLLIDGKSGDDTINASALPAGLTQLTIDGGSGNDTIIGSQGADTLIGGSGDDVITGGRGNDVAFLGSGNDTFIWNPGDGSDTVEGQSGFDTLLFNGANVAEMSISRPMVRGRYSLARLPTSRWTSMVLKRSNSMRSAAPTISSSTTSPVPM